MKKVVLVLLSCVGILSSCSEYTSVLKTTDYEYKYEFAKACFVKGQYSRSSTLLGDLLPIMKGTAYAEESLYMLGMSEYLNGNYDTASSFFKKYYQSYPKGIYAEYARFYCGKSLYEGVPDPRLDQSGTMTAIEEFQNFLDYYPYTTLKEKTQEMIFSLQDILVQKEYNAAKLYYDLGTYMGNCTSGGSNYEACIVTAENALRDFPYAQAGRREEFAILILRSKYHLAMQSIESKRLDRYRNTIDEYYGFVNEYPESKYLKEAERILASSKKVVENSK
ncbi:MAG: outer membrane protein assembly factor BamD [Paraprevotella sp.]|nr:outer membrane protein assembly factor BamD [Paraprevotella sp.]